VVQGGLASRPSGGENQGLRLEHEHVVRAASGPRAVHAASNGAVRLTLALPADLDAAGGVGLVAWTQDNTSARVLDATWARCPAAPDL
jgi:hypothetical protein